MKRRVPDLPIITDPSHICGNRERLLEISQDALDLDFNGLIIESHCDPDNAWSDKQQQVSPEDLQRLIGRLVIRKPEVKNGLLLTIGELRADIDKLDDQIIDIFEKRMQIAEEIGRYKKDNNIAILQTRRWDNILNKRLRMGKLRGLGEEFISKIFRAIHQESINHQNRIMNEDIIDQS